MCAFTTLGLISAATSLPNLHYSISPVPPLSLRQQKTTHHGLVQLPHQVVLAVPLLSTQIYFRSIITSQMTRNSDEP